MTDISIYENFRKSLISKLAVKKDTLIIKNPHHIDSIFNIQSKDDALYSTILEEFERIAISESATLISKLCEANNVEVIQQNSQRWRCDLVIKYKNENYIIEIKNTPNLNVLVKSAGDFKEQENKVIFVSLSKRNVQSLRLMNLISNHESIRDSVKSGKFQFFVFEDFLFYLFGEKEVQRFYSGMKNYNEEMHKAIGYRITELASPDNLEKLKEELKQEICGLDYQKMKDDRRPVAPNNDLYDDKFSQIKDSFINGKYELLFGNNDFSKSLITSEWIYQKYISLEGLDNTFIVSGYLKSIEQLLWSIIQVKGIGRRISGGVNRHTEIIITGDNDDEINQTLGSLEGFIAHASNMDLLINSLGRSKFFVQRYLKSQIDEWRDIYRNGFFHKHILDDVSKIKRIREETFFLYMLILGAIDLSDDDIAILSN